MRIFKTKVFARFARGAGLDDKALCKAIRNAERGLVDADLGGGVIKQRIARAGQGKSGGFRTVILYKKETMAFFVRGFAKSELDNIRDDELVDFKKLASIMLNWNNAEIEKMLASGFMTGVRYDD